MYDIMSYLTNPTQYCAVQAPPLAEEEKDWDDKSTHPFQSALLQLNPSSETSKATETDLMEMLKKAVDPAFPAYDRAVAILHKYRSVFATALNGSTITYPSMNIKPLKEFKGCAPRRLNAHKKMFLDDWIDRNLKSGKIEKFPGNPDNTNMPTSPLVLIKKPEGSADTYRATLDAKKVNETMPLIKIQSSITREIVQQLGSKNYYWCADMLDYYHQFRVSDETANAYAFNTHRGNFRFKNVLPQGDKNSAAWTTNAMQHLLLPLKHEVCNYVDDCAGSDDDPDELCNKLERFLKLMVKINAKLNPRKLKIGHKSIDCVGFVISKEGYKPRENQLDKFRMAPFPTKEKLRSWFGLLNTFRDFIPNLQSIDAAFSAVRKKNAPWIVTKDMLDAFEEAKMAVANIKLLMFPIEDKELYLDADASHLGCGAILYHLHEDGITKIPIRFMSHVFTTAAQKWSTIQKECWALVKSFNTFESILFGREFKVRTDHRNLLYMQYSCNDKVQRWFGYLMLFDFIIEHVPGVSNVVADAMSRILAFLAEIEPEEEEERQIAQQEQETEDNVWSPTDLATLFNRFHNGITGHLSLADTINAMRKEQCNAPHLKQQVIRLFSQCGPCQKSRKLRKKPILEAHTTSSFRPFDTVQMDFVTGMNTSSAGYNSILVCTCAFTRYTMLYPSKDQTALTVANSILHLWGIFGNISQITSDGAPCFTSKLVTDCCKLLRIKPFITFAHNPGSHGIVENRNKEVKKIAQKLYNDVADANETNWEQYLPLVQRILNSQTTAATGYSPHHMIFGTATTRDLKVLEAPPLDIASIRDPHKYLRELDNTLNIVFKSGLTSLEDTVIHNYLKQPVSNVSYKVGDYVLMPNHRARTLALGKFSPPLIGPLRVVKNFNNDFYQLLDIVQDEPAFAHGCDLRSFNCPNDQRALEIAASDYDELIIRSVKQHIGDPDKLGQLYFEVTFNDDQTITTLLPYREVKYVQIVRDYIMLHKNELHTAAADLRKQKDAPTSKRVRRTSQSLRGYDL